jgi:hypothetical protein
MAEFVFTNPYFTINGVDLADHVRSITLDYSADMVDATAGGDSTRTRLGGLKDWTATVEFLQDFAASKVDATIFPLVGTTTTIVFRPTNAAKSATNPEYSGTGIVESYPPVSGGIGDLATARVVIRAAGPLSRATS